MLESDVDRELESLDPGTAWGGGEDRYEEVTHGRTEAGIGVTRVEEAAVGDRSAEKVCEVAEAPRERAQVVLEGTLSDGDRARSVTAPGGGPNGDVQGADERSGTPASPGPAADPGAGGAPPGTALPERAAARSESSDKRGGTAVAPWKAGGGSEDAGA